MIELILWALALYLGGSVLLGLVCGVIAPLWHWCKACSGK
jgi:hypothetical protein